MNRILKLIAFVLALALLSLPVIGQMGDGKRGEDMMRGNAKEMHEKGNEIRNAQGMIGMGFLHREGNIYGSYVTFSVDNVTGEVMNYGISDINVFDSIKVSGFDLKDISTMGAVTKIINKNGSILIQLHDNPAAVINIMTKSKATIIFDLHVGVNAMKEDNIVKITANNLTAYIASVNATSANIAGGEVRIEIDKGFTIFRASPVNMPVGWMHREFMEEIIKKKAGAEISIGDSDKSSIVNYSDDMNVMIRSKERDRIRMMINSSDHSGKFLLMNIDNSSLTWNERQRIRLYLDNKPMRQFMNEQELYNASESSFWINMTGKNRMQAVMYIANFSERQVDIVVEDEGTPMPTPEVTKTATPETPGFGVALGLLCTAAVYRLRRRS